MGNAIASSLSNRIDMEVKAVVISIEDAKKYLDDCDLMLVSDTIPEDDFDELLKIAKKHVPRIHVLTMGLPEISPNLSNHIQAGANGYWSKGESPADLILEVMEDHLETSPGQRSMAVLRANVRRMGELAVAMNRAAKQSRRISDSIHTQINEFHQEQRIKGRGWASLDSLTFRQREVLELVNQGLSNAEIAEKLNIEIGTVKNHIHQILTKLGVDTREEAASIFRSQRRS